MKSHEFMIPVKYKEYVEYYSEGGIFCKTVAVCFKFDGEDWHYSIFDDDIGYWINRDWNFADLESAELHFETTELLDDHDITLI